MIEKTLARNKALTFGLLAATLMAMGLLLAATKPAHAVNSFTINNIGDVADTNTADNVCDAFSGQQCTLRAAIQQANPTPNSGGSDLIGCAVPGDGPHTIAPTSELPTIAQPVIIDGYTHGSASATTLDDATPNTATDATTNAVLKIVLDGTNAGPSRG